MANKSNIIDFHDSTLSNTFQDKLNQYRKEKNLTDVELQIGDKLFPAHRAVLSLNSPVLKAMISDQWLTTKTCPISEECVDPEIMEDLLNFLYTGSIQLTPDNLYSVCMAAHFLQIPTLFDASVKGLSKLITAENVLTLLVFFNSLSLDVLSKSCLELVLKKCEKVILDPEILHFTFKDFTDLIVELKNLCFGTSLREHTFDCLVRWTEFNLPERSEAFPVLLENIPLDEVSFRFLTQRVFTHKLVKESFPCIKNILKSLNFDSFNAFWNSELIPSTRNLIVIGGRKSSDEYSSVMSYYHADTQAWRRLPDMLHKRKDFAVTISDQRDIIVGGGFVEVDGLPQRTGSLERFCWKAHTWRSFPVMIGQDPDVIHSMVIHNDHLYVAAENEEGSVMLCVYRYCYLTQEWRCFKGLRSKHCKGTLISYNDHLYVIDSKSVKRMEKNQFTTVASMNNPTFSVQATVHRNKIYASGEGIFEVYDPETDVWTSLPVLPTEGSTSLMSLNGKLLAVPCNQQENNHSIYEFDLSNQQWKELADIPANLIPHYAIASSYY